MKKPLLCGVDLGGTKLSAGLFSQDGELVAEQKVTDHSDLNNDAMVDRIADLIAELWKDNSISPSDVMGVGVGLAGHINFREGVIITSSNFPIPFRSYPFREALEKQIPVPVILDNDANAQALGEYFFGAGVGKPNMVFMTVSTGVGAGIINEGKIIRGHSGFAGEIGHTIIEPGSPIRCTCGNYGCLMALSSTLGLAERYRRCLEDGMISGLGLAEDELDQIDGMLLERGVEEGDEIALTLFRESAANIGMGIYNLYQVVNPQTVILGGGLMKMGFGFLDLIKEKFESLVHHMADEKLEIVIAELGGRAGLVGAAALPLEAK